MFRTMRRFGQQVSRQECERLLLTENRAAFSVIGDNGYPYTIPIDFYYNADDCKIYFHGAKQGHKAEALQQCNKVCLTVWNQGYKKEGRWEWNATSVVVFGRAVPVTDPALHDEHLRRLAAKYYPSAQEIDEEMAHSSARAQVYAIEIEHMTGKLVNER